MFQTKWHHFSRNNYQNDEFSAILLLGGSANLTEGSAEPARLGRSLFFGIYGAFYDSSKVLPTAS